ncbi:HAD family hydrolase [Oceanobacillus piezotolerans]|uniref:Phosphoserine phosphatase n=1 Tax=Oceanobacillus piezotolerans TaxID=2448030 RepID=A0A498D8P8_9BACI|nr:HAD family hydrolase [Oceanobacillus piezotolerans]RLL46773.1 HAD family hydrolase [Oceanobacillus piezotolerans]
MIKAICFDLDDTLLWDEKSISLAFHGTCKLAAEKYEIDPELLERKVRESARELYESYDVYPFTKMIGINPFEGLWGTFNDEGEEFAKLREVAPAYQKQAWAEGLKKVGIEDSDFAVELAKTFPKVRKESPMLYEDSLEVLDALKDKYQLFLLTNGSPELQNIKLSITPELRPYFEGIVISGEFGRGKPDHRIFQHVLEKLNLNSEEVLMVGDNLNTDILGANRADIRSVWINRKGVKRTDGGVPTYEIYQLRDLLGLLKTIE